MTITLERELPPIQFDVSGALRVGNSRVLLMPNDRQNSLKVARDTVTQQLNFGDALVKLRQENDLGEIDIDPEILAQLRDQSAGREVI